jgi:hypothetical protein
MILARWTVFPVRLQTVESLRFREFNGIEPPNVTFPLERVLSVDVLKDE